MEMPKPAAAHRKLERVVGLWTGEEKLFPSPWDPKGGTAISRVENRLALDGFAVVQDYEQERNGKVNFRGHGVLRWEAQQQCYEMYWFDSMGMAPNIFRGSFEDNVLTMTNKQAQGYTRAVWDFRQDGQYQYRMELSQDGNQWQLFIEGHYTAFSK